MTDDQLALDGREPLPVGVALTARQELALAFVRRHGTAMPVTNDELGAVLHEERRRRGGKGHGADTRCAYCADEGRDMGARLRDLGLIVRAADGSGWRPSSEDAKPEARPSGMLPDDEPLPFA